MSLNVRNASPAIIPRKKKRKFGLAIFRFTPIIDWDGSIDN